VASVDRVVVGVHGSLGSLQALRYAVSQARERDIPLVAVTAWVPPGGDIAERRSPSAYLRQVWREAACQRLLVAFEDALGGLPQGVRLEPCVVRGDAAAVLVDVASHPGDLLVIGTGRRGRISRALRRSVARYCLAHATCPVVAVPPSPLMDEAGRRRFRHWSRRPVTWPTDSAAEAA
jgi:nucleotide-binding universal stress UspA family protein